MNYEFTKNDTLIAKGIAIILMYLHHLFYFDDRIIEGNYYSSIGNLWGEKIEFFAGSFGKLCVCIFIFLSGYATYKTFIYKRRKSDFVYKKIIKFYRIYLIVFAIFVPVGMILKDLKFSIYEFINNLFLLESSYNWEWWFARPFVILMFFFPLIVKFFNDSNEEKTKDIISIDIIKVVIAAIIITTILPQILELNFFEAFRKTEYYTVLNEILGILPSFLSGYVFAKYDLFKKYNSLFNNDIIRVSVSIFAVLAVFDFRCKTGVNMDYDYIYAPIFIISCTNIVNRIKYINNMFISIGKLSTYMWLMHSFFCYYYFQSFIYMSHNPIIIVCSLTLITYAVSFVIDRCAKFIEETMKSMKNGKAILSGFTNIL